jgi:hypothetical protein
MAAGAAVSLAWSLPPGPRPQLVVVYRAEKDTATFEELRRVDAAALSMQDDSVQLGRTYLYRVATVRGAAVSPLSPAAEVLVGGGARVLLRGGSTDRAVFEVTVYRAGRRLSATFVHAAGDRVGDLVHVAGLDRIEDFRLGLVLRELSLSRAIGQEASLQELRDSRGETMLDPGGKPLRLEFRFPGHEREVLVAALALKDGRIVALTEGETLNVP